MWEMLAMLPLALVQAGRPRLAARLLGLARSVLGRRGIDLTATPAHDLDPADALLRQQLAAPAFDALLAEGERLTEDDIPPMLVQALAGDS